VIPDYEHAYSIALQDKENLISSLHGTVAAMDHGSLSELRALQRAPEEVEELLVAVIVIMKGPSADFSWTKGAKRLMANLDRYTLLYINYQVVNLSPTSI
jgi:transcriptional regulatory protein LevR